MTDRELMQAVLEAMESLHRTGDTQVFDLCYAPELIPALRERLAQPKQETVMVEYKFRTYAAYTADGEMKIGVVPQQEPVAWGMRDMNGNIYDCISAQEHARAAGSYNVPLYNRHQWQGLTETEQVQVAIDCGCADVAWLDFARAIEAKLKEKNT